MTEQRVTRRTALKAGAGAGLFTTLAGCLDSGSSSGNGDGPGGEGSLDAVPSGSTAIVSLDTGRLLDGELVRRSFDRALEIIQRTRTADLPIESYDEALSMVESETGLDPKGLQSVQFFSGASGSTAGLLFEADWSEDEIVSTIEEQGPTLTSRSEDGHTIYADEEGTEGLVALADGRYLLAESATIDSVLAVLAGEAEPVGGDLADAYADTTGMVRFAVDVSEVYLGGDEQLSAVEDATMVAGSLTASGDTRTFTMDVSMTDSDAATRMAEQANAALTLAEGQLDQYPEVQELIENPEAQLDAVEVSHSGSTVTVTYGGSVELVAEGGMLALAAVVGSFVLGLGQSTGPTTPSITFQSEYHPDEKELRVTITNVGDAIQATEIHFRGDISDSSTINDEFHEQSASVDATATLTAGNEATIDSKSGNPVEDNYDIDIVWESDSGESSTLQTLRGPGA